jgi:peptidoglycan/LPS O-acetylase OafA/YrhL
MTSAGSRARLDGVDILRGLAIFLVLMNHVNIRLLIAKVPYTEGLPDQLVSSLVWNGQPGVQIFFAISGFLITSMTLRRWGSLKRVSVRDFYLFRFARIAPLLVVLLTVLSLLHFAHFKDYVVTAKTGGLGRALLAALTFHVNVLEARRGYLPGSWDVLWSLSVEEMFYLFFPLVCRLLGRGKPFVALLLGFVALGPFARTTLAHGSEIWKEYSYLGSMDAIALGCLTALLVSRLRVSRSAVWTLGTLGTGLLISCLCFSMRVEDLGLGSNGMDITILAIGTCMVIVAAATTGWSSPRLIRPLLRLGQHSYEVYLTHMFVVFALFRLFLVAGKRMSFVPALFIVVIVVAGLAGEVVARFYSEPLNRLIRKRWGSRVESLG